MSRKEAICLLWQRSVLHWKLNPTQKDLYDMFQKATARTIVWSAARRTGKSYSLCTIAVEMCLKKPHTIVKYTAPTQKAVRTIIHPIIRDILKDCPKELRPEFKTADNVYRFKNGSEIQLAGTDSGNAENLRGGQAHLCVVDEAGFVNDLDYVVTSILIPTMTLTDGKVILASTPPVSPDHDFNRFVEQAQAENAFVKKTVYDNPMLTYEQLQSIIRSVGGKQSNQFRREYLCEMVRDEERSVVPEFTADLKLDIVREWERPPFFDAYTAMDLGLRDLTVVLFAYFDFRADKLIIEDELCLNGARLNTSHLAKGIKEKEASLWTHPMSGEVKAPYLRVSDNNLIVIQDLRQLHQLNFVQTQKDNSDAALNNMRIMLESGRIIIHPRCKTLIRHLENATWDRQHKSFERSKDNGHYDAIDALKYLVRNVQFTRNPYPKGYNIHFGDDRMANPTYKPNQPSAYEALKSIFQTKKNTSHLTSRK